MAQPLPRHPAAVVLRPQGLRTLIAVAIVALVLAAAAAVAAVVADDDPVRTSSPVPERVTDSISSHTEQRRAAIGGKAAPVGARFDGGPEEGSRGVGR